MHITVHLPSAGWSSFAIAPGLRQAGISGLFLPLLCRRVLQSQAEPAAACRGAAAAAQRVGGVPQAVQRVHVETEEAAHGHAGAQHAVEGLHGQGCELLDPRGHATVTVPAAGPGAADSDVMTHHKLMRNTSWLVPGEHINQLSIVHPPCVKHAVHACRL